MSRNRDDEAKPKSRLIARLRTLAEHDTSASQTGATPPFVSAFVSRKREVVGEFASAVLGLVVVVEGRKLVASGACDHRYGAGEAFLLPAGARIDVINEPDEASGTYRALFLRFSRDLIIEAARLWPEFVGQPPGERVVDLDSDLCDAIIHAGQALRGASRRIVEHRLLEVVLVLAERGAMGLTPKYVGGSIAEAVRILIRHRLDRDWSADSVARSFAISEATLRRRLRQEGHSLRDLLLSERMQAAWVLLHDRDAEVAEAIAATGYTSRSHFARHFQRAFGLSPSSARRRRMPPIPA